MSTNVLFSASEQNWHDMAAPLDTEFAKQGLTVNLSTHLSPAEVDYVVYAPNGPLRDFTPFTRCKAVLSLWAGVESIVSNRTMTQPLARIIDEGMVRRMSEWVAGHVLRHHLGMDADIMRAPGAWEPHAPPLATERSVTVLGLGELGGAVSRMLAEIGFRVTGWSRSQKLLPGVICLSGEAGLREALASTEILVLLLPDTPETDNTLNARTLALLPKNAIVINPGRGSLIDDDALIAALDNGDIGHATLDVFRQEPLPEHHPFWHHPKVTVTPHAAAASRPETAAQVIAENVRRCEAGEPLLNQVDRALGY